LQDWWISLAGNLVSVVFGFLGLGGIFLAKKSWQKYLFVSFARTQFTLTLIGYPLMSLVGFFGDWVWIYGTSWWLTIPTAIAHLSLVVGLFLVDRSAFARRWEIGLYPGGRDQLKQLDATIQARPGIVDPIIARGNYYASQNQFDLAITDYRAALKMDSQNPRALYNIGQIRLMQKKYTDAEKYFRSAMARAESDIELASRVHFGLGMCLYHRGGAAKAITEFDAAIARNSENPQFYYWRGTARKALGDEVNAQNDFARAEQLSSVNSQQ
jgi:tetratricopeptide (TPR) repeat protein